MQRKSHLCVPRKGIARAQMGMRAIYLFPGSGQNKETDRGITVYKSLTDTWMWNFGKRPRNFFSVNIVSNFRNCFFPERWNLGELDGINITKVYANFSEHGLGRGAWGHKEMSPTWLTNSAIVYEPKWGRRGGCGVSANKYSVHMDPK
jgi:hypothetical protein